MNQQPLTSGSSRGFQRAGLAILGLALLASSACVEQSREKKKFGRTFESSRSGAYMPFNFVPVPEGRWVDPATEWKTNSGATATSR